MADPSTALALHAVAWVTIIAAISFWLGYLRGKIAGLKLAREVMRETMQAMQDSAPAPHRADHA